MHAIAVLLWLQIRSVSGFVLIAPTDRAQRVLCRASSLPPRPVKLQPGRELASRHHLTHPSRRSALAAGATLTLPPTTAVSAAATTSPTPAAAPPLALTQRLTFVTEPSGLRWAEVRPGAPGALVAAPGSVVLFDYVGRLAGRQGWVFGSSFEEGEPQVC